MNLLMMFISFCGGAFGAMVGALAAFIMCGVVGLVGIAFAVTGMEFDWIGIIAFGPFFGPHISFGAGVAAAAYAKKKGYLNSGKDIVTGLVSLEKMDVLIVGGIFGVLAYVISYIIGLAMPGIIDGTAATVVISAAIAKMVFSGELIGSVKDGGKRFGKNASEVWVPYMRTVGQQTMIAIAAGGLSAFVTMIMLQDEKTAGVAAFVGFCISAISLIFANIGTAVPTTHHITLCASYGVLASGGNLAWGIAGAIIAAVVCDLMSRVLYCYGDVHIDPPAMGIMVTSLILLGLFPAVGVYSSSIIAYGIIGVAVVYGLVESRQNKEVLAPLENQM
jgi:hypothetical protein